MATLTNWSKCMLFPLSTMISVLVFFRCCISRCCLMRLFRRRRCYCMGSRLSPTPTTTAMQRATALPTSTTTPTTATMTKTMTMIPHQQKLNPLSITKPSSVTSTWTWSTSNLSVVPPGSAFMNLLQK
ncbi:MAG: hypothetical protein J3R72DRAFT_458564 [Linnemannia gamsii]|nr:MAG: hypothetical protein J3R72DRAFT_458564 [Linnemannia gamsii]